MDAETCLIWNVRGLNAWARCDMVRTVVEQERVSLVCLQETKLHVIDDSIVCDLMGGSFDYFFLPVDNTRGGILMAWRSNVWLGSNFTLSAQSVLVKLTLLVNGFST